MKNKNYYEKKQQYQQDIDGQILSDISNQNKELSIIKATHLRDLQEAIDNCTEIGLEPKHFYNERFGKAYLRAMDKRDKVAMTNIEWIPSLQDLDFLDEYNFEEVDETNYQADALDIIELYNKRQVISGALKVISEAREEKTIDELKNTLEKTLTESTDKYSSLQDIKFDDIYNNPQGNKGVPTGFSYLDKSGVKLLNGQLIAIGADTGAGKTTLMINIMAYQLKLGGKVLFFSLEQSATEIVYKLLTILTGYSKKMIQEGKCSREEIESNYNLIQKNLFLIYKDGLGIAELKTRAKIIHSRENISLICVDYWQLVGNAKTIEDLVDTANGLNQLAISLDLPVIVIGQVSKADSRQTLDRNSFSGSKQLSNNASYILMIEHNKEIKANVVEIVKSRETGHYKKKVVLDINPANERLSENLELTQQLNSIR